MHLDAYLIEDLLTPLGGRRERAAAWLFRKLFAELLAPKRSGTQVVRHLVREFPELAPDTEPMLAEVRALGQDRGMVALMEDPAAMPVARTLLHRHPGFRWSADLT